MKDLTQGPIFRQIVTMALPILAGMLLQTLYFVVDLYFVARLGNAAIAGVSAAGNVMFIILALTQMLGVGVVALIAQAVGRTDQPEANLVFNQSLALAALCAAITLAGGYAFSGAYMARLGADAATAAAGTEYLHWFLPGLALQFAQVAMGSALRGTGIVKPTMVVQSLTVLCNAVLAPVLIAGWGTGRPMGVAGAGLASTLSIAAGVGVLTLYFTKLEKYVSLRPTEWRPRLAVWGRMLRIGLPAGGEFALLFIYMGVVYSVIRPFGSEAQAGFGLGGRIMQSVFLPAMAVAFATAPVVGQNFGARRPERVRGAFRAAALLGGGIMLVLTLLCQGRATWLVRLFTDEPGVVAAGGRFLEIVSWNFVAAGFTFTASSLFQGLGNTLPSLISSATRLVTFAVPAIWLSRQPGFALDQLWHLSVATVWLQALVSLWLVQRELLRRLATLSADGIPVVRPT